MAGEPSQSHPGLMQRRRVTPGSQGSQRGHCLLSPMAGVSPDITGMLSPPTLTMSCPGGQPVAGAEGAHPAAWELRIAAGNPWDTSPCHRSSGTAPGHPANDANPRLAWELCALIQGQGFICFSSNCYWIPLRQEPRQRQSPGLEAMDLYQG